MKSIRYVLAVTLSFFIMCGCDQKNRNNHRSTAEVVNASKLCNRKGLCLHESQLLAIRETAQSSLRKFISSIRWHEFSEADQTRLRALSLDDAYRFVLQSDLGDESAAFINELYQTIFEKD